MAGGFLYKGCQNDSVTGLGRHQNHSKLGCVPSICRGRWHVLNTLVPTMRMIRTSPTRPTLRGLALALAAVALSSILAQAVPYASQVTTNGNTISFILNQDAQGLVVLRDGANPVYPGTTAGQLSFDMTGYTTWSIIVTGSTAKAWTQFIPDGGNSPRNFWMPTSVAINKKPGSPHFGKVYIANNRNASGVTSAGRTTPDGIYVLRADGAGISGPHTGGVQWTSDGTSYSRPHKINLNPDDDCVYVASYYDDLAFGFNEDLSVCTQLVDASNKTTGQYIESIYATGKQSDGTRQIFTVNSHYLDARRGLISYNLGANAKATSGDTGTQAIGPSFYTYYPGDVDRDSNGNWYMTQYRSSSGEAAAVNRFDGSLAWPINTSVWGATSSHTYIKSVGVNEAGGTVAVGKALANTGNVYFYDIATGANKGSLASRAIWSAWTARSSTRAFGRRAAIRSPRPALTGHSIFSRLIPWRLPQATPPGLRLARIRPPSPLLGPAVRPTTCRFLTRSRAQP